MQSTWFSLRRDTAITARVAAIAEPGFVLIGGTLLARILLSQLRAGDANHYLYDLPAPDFLSAAAVQFLNLTVRYGLILGLAVIVGLWRGRSTAESYGVTLGDRRFSGLLSTGILLGLIASVPEQMLRIVNHYAPLGPGTRFWALEGSVKWDAAFWLYMAVGSYLVVPIFEELFTRGYLLGRVRESFSPGVSLLITAAFFTFSHGQYRHADVLSVGTMTGLMIWSMLCGYAVYRTGSLVPAIIAHGIGNVPMTVEVRWGMLMLSLLALAVWREAFASWMAGIIQVLRDVDDWLTAAVVVVAILLIAITIKATPWMPYVWFAALAVLTAIGIRRRSAWAARS